MLTDRQLYAATAQIYGLGKDSNVPISSGSGMVAKIGGTRYVLTVAHNAERCERFGVHIDHDLATKGSYMYVTNSYGIVKLLKLGKAGECAVDEIDFTWFNIPDDCIPKRTSVAPIDGEERIENTEFDLDKGVSPMMSSEDYSFAGVIKVGLASLAGTASYLIKGDLAVHRGFRYERSVDEYHVFKIPYDPFPGHDAFRGCSGSPILDGSGNPVALVVGSRPDMPFYGVGLQRLCELIRIQESGVRPIV